MLRTNVQNNNRSAKSREGKVVTGWTAETRTPEGRPQRDAGSVRYSAAIESAATRDTDPEVDPFYLRVRRMAARCGFAEAERRVVLGDGAPWIWKLAYSECPGAVQIVDLWHAKEKLWEVSHALYGAGESAKQWAHAQCDDLEQGRFDDLLAVLRTHEATCETARLCVGYFETNRARMRYTEFRQQGLCVGSGVVEAGCKTVIGERCKRSGMRWTVDGANAILALRFSVGVLKTTGHGGLRRLKRRCRNLTYTLGKFGKLEKGVRHHLDFLGWGGKRLENTG